MLFALDVLIKKKNCRYYEALIEEVCIDSLKVKFDGYNTPEVVPLNDVKTLGVGVKRPLSGDESK